MSDSNDRLQVLREQLARGVSTQRASHVETRHSFAEQTQTQKAVASEVLFDIANNAVNKVMTDPRKSDKQKIEELTTYLVAQGEDYETVRKHFAEFNAYFSYTQNQREGLDEKGIEQLIKELEGQTQAQIDKIVKDITTVNTGAEKIKNLITVLHDARVTGQTLPAIQEALRLNDELIKAIQDLDETIGSLQETKTSREARLGSAEAEKTESHQGLRAVLRIFGENREIVAKIATATQMLHETEDEITNTTDQRNQKNGQRKENLESGPLTILRSIEASEDGFVKEIIGNAKDSLTLLDGVKSSLAILITTNARSRTAAETFEGAISGAEIRETILNGAVQKAADTTHEQSVALKERVDEMGRRVEAAAGDVAESALLKNEHSKMQQTFSQANNYEAGLKDTIANLVVTAADTVNSKNRADDFSRMVDNHAKLLVSLHDQALPTTARALHMGLEQAIALRDAQLAAAVREVLKKGQETYADGRKQVMESVDDLHREEILRFEDTIKILNEAEDFTVTTIEHAVEHGIAKKENLERLQAAAKSLSNVSQQANEITNTVAGEVVSGINAAPTDEPGRPGGAPATPEHAVSMPMVA